MLDFAYDLVIGRPAPVTSGVAGIIGSLLLAVPPLRTLGARRALFQLARVALNRKLAPLTAEAERKLIVRSLREIEIEKLCGLAGAACLTASFAVLLASSLK